MFQEIKTTLGRNLTNARGWRTNRKIVVFESDDWGSIRMFSQDISKKFYNQGYQVHKCPYNSNDRIESNSDLKGLINVLSSVTDSKGNYAKFTMNNIVANPDFNKIKQSGFMTYYYEPFVDTLKYYSDTDKVIELYKEGLKKKVFQVQFHGREHLNIGVWMRRLQEGHNPTVKAFKERMFTIYKSGSITGRNHALDAFGKSLEDDISFKDIIKDGLNLFYDIWGFRPKSFIAPCYTWDTSIEPLLHDEGIKYIQGSHVQIIPANNPASNIKKRYHYTGQRNNFKQVYLVRNASFEPTENGKDFRMEKTLKEIKTSFLYKKPAIISSHRVNYIGSINPENKEKNLLLLENLLKEIVKRWPEVEFLSTDEVGDLITHEF